MKTYLFYPRLGAFEIYWNQELIYSKRLVQAWPEFSYRAKPKIEEILPFQAEDDGSSQDKETTDRESSEEVKQEDNKPEEVESETGEEPMIEEDEFEIIVEYEEGIEQEEIEQAGDAMIEEDDFEITREYAQTIKQEEDQALSECESVKSVDKNIEITLAYEMELPLHKLTSKKFKYSNSGFKEAEFELLSSHPQLLVIKQAKMKIQPHKEALFLVRFNAIEWPCERQYVISVVKNGKPWDNILFSVFYKP